MYNFIVNERSGKYRGQKAIRKITEYCNDNKIEYQVYITNAVGHAKKLTEELCMKGETEIIAVGGDGTFHEVLNGIVDFSSVTVGFIPAGRGNDFARSAHLSLDPIEAFEDITKNQIKKIDFIKVGDDLRCLNVAGTGMDVDVLQAVIDKKNAISYYTSLVSCILRYKPYRVKITLNGETYEKDCIMVGICNGGYIGGGMHIGTNAEIDDAKLDICIVEKQKRGLLGVLPSFVKGKHEKLPECIHIDAERIEVDSFGKPIELDGEIYDGRTLTCEIVKGGLRTYKTGYDLSKELFEGIE